MKKILFLLVALMGVVGMAKAENRTFNVSVRPLPIYFSETGNKSEAFYVTYGGTKAEITAAASAYLTDGDGTVYGATLAQEADKTVTLEVAGTVPTSATNLTLTIEAGSFASGVYENSVISVIVSRKNVTWKQVASWHKTNANAVAQLVQFFETRTFTKTITVTGDEVKSAANVAGLKKKVNGNSVEYTLDYSSFIDVEGTGSVTIPAGAIVTKRGSSPAYTIAYKVAPQNFDVKAEIKDNKSTKVTLTFFDDPTDHVFDVASEAVSFDATSFKNIVVYEGEEKITVTNVTYKYSADNYATYEFTLPKEISAGEHIIYAEANDKFQANGKTAEIIYGKLNVAQKVVDTAFKYTSTELAGNDFDLVIKDLAHTLPTGVQFKKAVYTLEAGDEANIYLTNESGLVNPSIKSIATDGTITLGSKLANSGDYHLVIKKDALAFMGSDNILYVLAKDLNAIVVVDHIYRFEDKNGAASTKVEDLVANEYYNHLYYTRTVKAGVQAAWVAPFNLTGAQAAANGLTLKKITAVTNDEGVYNIHVRTVKATETANAYMPYLVVSENDNIAIELTGDKAKFEDYIPQGVYSSTTDGASFYFQPTANGAYLANVNATDNTFIISSKNGSVTPIQNTGLASYDEDLDVWNYAAKMTPWRLWINVYDIDTVDYSKFVVVEDETTGINTVATSSENGAMFNVAGQRISAPVKGQVYIMNGKKYIAK